MKKSMLLTVMLFALISINAFSAQPKKVLKLTYFHATIRCEGCIQIENFIKMTLDEYYKKEIQEGKIEFKSLDFMQPENEKAAEKYKVESQEFIASIYDKDKEIKWINLDKVWDNSSSYEKFKKYIKTEIDKLLKKL